MFGSFATTRLLKSCSFLAHCTPSPSFMNVHWGIPLCRYIGRQFLLLVSIIRTMTGKRRGQSLQHLQRRLLNILSFQPLDFIKEIGIIQTLVFKYCSFFQPNVYNSRQINNIDRFGTQIQRSFVLLLHPNKVVVLDYENYTLFWFWFHLNIGFFKVTSSKYSRLSLRTQLDNTLQISNNNLDGEILNPYIYRTKRKSNKQHI